MHWLGDILTLAWSKTETGMYHTVGLESIQNSGNDLSSITKLFSYRWKMGKFYFTNYAKYVLYRDLYKVKLLYTKEILYILFFLFLWKIKLWNLNLNNDSCRNNIVYGCYCTLFPRERPVIGLVQHQTWAETMAWGTNCQVLPP